MKKKKSFESFSDILEFLLGLIVLVGVLFVTYNVCKFTISGFKVLIDKYPTISVALITGLLAFISVLVGKYLENKYTIKNKIREERQKIYTDFLNWIINNVLYAGINNNKDIVDELKYYQKEMTIYASDKALKAWAEFRDISMNSILLKEDMDDETKNRYYIKNEAPYLEKLILAIRKELGYKNKNIKEYDILKLYVPDMIKYLD